MKIIKNKDGQYARFEWGLDWFWIDDPSKATRFTDLKDAKLTAAMLNCQEFDLANPYEEIKNESN